MPLYLARIVVYPIKSLPGVETSTAALTAGGGLQDDRRWALFDAAGETVNGKRFPRLHEMDADFQLAERRVRLRDRGRQRERTFELAAEMLDLEAWLSEALGQEIYVRENDAGGFPDDPDNPGPTVVSESTLDAAAAWFAGLTREEVRRRFRANLEIAGGEPFWEDRLVGPEGVAVEFRLGTVRLWGVNPCQRCAVPSRDSRSGEVWPGFARSFSSQRQATLPAWAERSRFDHYYRLAVNTRIPPDQASPLLRVGDEVAICESSAG